MKRSAMPNLDRTSVCKNCGRKTFMVLTDNMCDKCLNPKPPVHVNLILDDVIDCLLANSVIVDELAKNQPDVLEWLRKVQIEG